MAWLCGGTPSILVWHSTALNGVEISRPEGCVAFCGMRLMLGLHTVAALEGGVCMQGVCTACMYRLNAEYTLAAPACAVVTGSAIESLHVGVGVGVWYLLVPLLTGTD
jgi:hypothetical protein